MTIESPHQAPSFHHRFAVDALEAALARGVEECPLCALTDVVACPACDGHGWIVFDADAA